VQHKQRFLRSENGIPSNLLDALHDQVSRAISKSSSLKTAREKIDVEPTLQPNEAQNFGARNPLTSIDDVVQTDSGQHAISLADPLFNMDITSSAGVFSNSMAMDWAQTQGQSFGGFQLGQMETEWDALALAFDLPSLYDV
jgi:hypothetical protein